MNKFERWATDSNSTAGICEGTMAQPKQTITDEIDYIKSNINDIAAQVNEISIRLYGGSTPKIEEPSCNAPVEKTLVNTIDRIKSDSKDIKNMLTDILKDL